MSGRRLTEDEVFLRQHSDSIRLQIEEYLPNDDRLRRATLALFDAWTKHPETELSPNSLANVSKVNLNTVSVTVSQIRQFFSKRELYVAGDIVKISVKPGHYRLIFEHEADPHSALKTFWSPYLANPALPIEVVSVKRLFFRLNKDVYIRNGTVNHTENYVKCEVLRKMIKESPVPARQYASSGEVGGIFHLLDMFSNKLKVLAKGSLLAPEQVPNHSPSPYSHIVLLGSGREEKLYTPPQEKGFIFKITPKGICKKGRLFTDRLSEEPFKVHVLMTRWREDKAVRTTFYGCHGSAIDGIIAKLAESKYVKLVNQEKLSEDFELLFQVSLDRSGTGYSFSAARIFRNSKFETFW